MAQDLDATKRSGTIKSSEDVGGSRSGKSCSKSTSIEFREAIADPDSEAFCGEGGMVGNCGFFGYFAIVFGIVAACSALSIVLWSEMGCGATCHAYLHKLQAQAGSCILFGFVLLWVLYMLDFFCPPHLPGSYCRLWKQDQLVGRLLLVAALASFLASSLIVGDRHPTVPIILSMFFSPACVLLVRWLIKPADIFVYADEEPSLNASSESVDSLESFERKMHELRHLTGGQRDQRNFYLAVGYAYAACGFLCSIAFFAWAVQDTTVFEDVADPRERELLFIRWAAPLGMATSNFMFGLLMWLRVVMHSTYSGTDETRARLVVEAASRKMSQDIMRHRMRAVASTYSAGEGFTTEAWTEMRGKIEDYLQQQCVSVQKLTNIIKILNATMLVIFGALFVTFQFTARGSHYAAFAQQFVGALALSFAVLTMVTFSRLWWKLGAWLSDLPLWKSAIECTRASWFRAAFVMLLLPTIPIVLALSSVNQLIRRARRLPNVGKQVLTTRVSAAVSGAWNWDWVPITLWCYAWGVVLVLYKAMPILLNVFLAWMGDAMEGFNFFLLLAVTFASGFFLFMLPPVPGPPIYLFGGFVISDRCPWGFWWGTLICITLCFVLKLVACAVQQKIIGGLMSNSLWVRQTCGVHKPLMRAIERVLRKPGLSFGKVMILCGGPDWPTSVLAGILRISLFQCELGTSPIISSVVTLCLSGSFYLKGAEGEVWTRMGNFMFMLTGVLNTAFWAGLAWAIQDEFDKSQHEITKPREEFVELEWLDYRSSRISERCRVRWEEVPRLVRVLYGLGALCLGLVGHLFVVTSRMCFGTFQLGDELATVEWTGREGLIRPFGVLGLYAAAASFVLLVPYKVWRGRQSRLLIRQAAKELIGEEEAWKAARIQEARAAAAEDAIKGQLITDAEGAAVERGASLGAAKVVLERMSSDLADGVSGKDPTIGAIPGMAEVPTGEGSGSTLELSEVEEDLEVSI